MSALVSLVMPVWRPRPGWLREAVVSALQEHACQIELIVVDDACEEPVAGLLAGIEDPRLRVLRIEHAGPYGARNAGIAAARGTLCASSTPMTSSSRTAPAACWRSPASAETRSPTEPR